MASAAAKPKREKKAPAPAVELAATVVGYKGFDANLACRGYQFAIGQTYTHKGRVEACSSGFHFCESPLDVWSYYDLGNDNRFARVHGSGALDRHQSDTKVAAETLFVESEVTLGEMIRAGVRWEVENAFAKAKAGEASGDSARNASSGDYARNASSGDYATNASSGHYATNASSGDSARNASSGHYATNEASGANSVIAAAGIGSRSKGAIGTALAMLYRDDKGQFRFATGVVGEDSIPANVWLIVRDDRIVAEAA